MPCGTTSSLANSTRSPTYFTVQITCTPLLKPPNLSTAALVSYLLYKLNRISETHHPCLILLPVFTLFVSPWSIRTLTFGSTYNLLINLLSCQSIPLPFRICINLVQLTWSNAFCQSTKQAHNSSSISKIHSDIILCIPITSLVPFPLVNPN
jgi:hypothetical protein